MGVGGVSLGGIVSQHVAGRCAAWPEAMRPDMAFLGATSAHIDEVVLGSEITRALGVDAAVRAAGWTAERLRQLRPLLDPPASAGIPPENVVAVLGRRDRHDPRSRSRSESNRPRRPPTAGGPGPATSLPMASPTPPPT